MEEFNKAKFWKCALQVNPWDYAKYRGQKDCIPEDEYNRQLLEICLEEKIKIVGIANHGDVTAIENIKKY
tara:strand:- start:588 stop:797 length:210 start_codon:yes stop_codon:yes gene_type:complete